MALLDLSLVTKTLVEVIKRAINASPAKPSGTINVTSLPPDRLEDLDNAVGMYLYHFVEDAAYKNEVWPHRPATPIRHSPIALDLYYVLSAHTKGLESEGPYREQTLLGLATKALHDFPIIKRDTRVAGGLVMPTVMADDDNKIRVTLRHVPANEAVSFWTAGSKPLRLCAYYEVSVVLIEPEEPKRATGRVLSYGIETFVGGLPRLETSRNTVSFTVPGETTARSVELQPAQAAIGDSFTLIARALGSGTLELLVRGPAADQPSEVGSTWGATAFGDEISATVQPTIGMTPSVPGTYGASVRMTRTSTLSNGTTHQTDIVSNEAPFQIVPAVNAFTVPTAAGVFTVTGGVFKHATVKDVRASIGGVELKAGTLGGLNPAEFAVQDETRIEMRIPDTATPGSFLPVRVIINGSESQPRWVQAP
jgi:hypothetical protein